MKKHLPAVNKLFREPISKKTPGSAPGTVIHIGKKHLKNISVSVCNYNEDHLTINIIDDINGAIHLHNSDSVTWIKVTGLHDVDKLTTLWRDFSFHPLIEEDIVNATQRAKVEDYGEQYFIVLKMLSYENNTLNSEQISLVLGKNYVFSFQETNKDFFQPVLKRLNVENSRLRKSGEDYLVYALMDTVVDYYFVIIEEISNQIDHIEENLFQNSDKDMLTTIHKTRNELVQFRKMVRPLRDSLNFILRDDTPLIQSETKLFFRDVYDHIVQISDTLDNNLDLVMSMHELYMTQISNKMNEVMKLLTVISTIFIPLSFITGIYGMNFVNMPELGFKWGYFAVMGLMLIITIFMVFYFKKKRWL